MSRSLILLALIAGCGPAVAPNDVPNLGGEPLWEPLRGDGDDQGGDASPVPEAEQRPPGAIALVDATDAAGLGAIASGGNTHGVGVGFVDVTSDGWPDIVLITGQSNVTGEHTPARLLANRQDGTFEDVTATSGLEAILEGVDGYSVATGDLDNDGDVDLYVGAQPRDFLLQNEGDGTFIDATEAMNAGGPASDPTLVGNGKSKVVSIGDIDNDGWLDLVSASSTLPFPGAYLLRNRGDGTFEDVTEQSGITIAPTGNPCAVMWSDYDTDADRDLWIWNDRGGKVLLANDGQGILRDVTSEAGLDAVQIGNPMGIDAADIDHDGDLDYYVSNIGNNPLLRNNGDGTFSDITSDAGTGGQYGWGLAFEDFNLDGWPDLFVAQEDDRANLVFQHDASVPPTFTRFELSHPAVIDSNAAHNVAAAFADYDRDGRVDALVAGTDGGRITLYRNETDVGTAGWLQVDIEVPAELPRPSKGIGARIVVATGSSDEDEQLQFRDVTGGSSRASQNELGVRFGLGQFRGARWVGVLWPTGEQTLIRNVDAGQRLTVQP